MKAKEYFEKFQTENQEQSPDWRLIMAFRQMVLEISDIAKIRKVQIDSGLIPIFKEQVLKCNAFCKMVNETEHFKTNGTIKKDAFKLFIELEQPELAKLVWNEN